MAKRIAPEGGYGFGRKRDYRRKVWATFRETIKRQGLRPVASAHALLMPSIEGAEIEVALNAGFRESNLHVVDSNPAIVAQLKTRYPKINTYGVSLGRAAGRIAAKGVFIHAANLDLCSQISKKLDAELGQVVSSGCLSPFACVAVTVLRGREDPRVTTDLRRHGQRPTDGEYPIFDALSDSDVTRSAYIGWRIAGKRHIAQPIRVEHYLSSNGQSFLWSVYALEPIIVELWANRFGRARAKEMARLLPDEAWAKAYV